MIIKDGIKKYEFRMSPNPKKNESKETKKDPKIPDFFCFFDIPGTADKDGQCKVLKVSLWKHISKEGKEYYTGLEMLEGKGK
jgi:hypothetical protein